tara:strand:- start:3576 stop:4547 length:972 start_codon:yes stop_codon:yes gene_type:complete
MRFRVITKEEGEAKYGPDYQNDMGFNDDGLMAHVFGMELDEDALRTWKTSKNKGHDSFCARFYGGVGDTASSSWSVGCSDVVPVSEYLRVKTVEEFASQYGDNDVWLYDNMFAPGMEMFIGLRLMPDEIKKFMSSVVCGGTDFGMRGWTFENSWIAEYDGKVVKEVVLNSADLSSNIITINRGDIRITISRCRKEGEETVFFVDGEDGISYEIDKSMLSKTEEGTNFKLMAVNIITGDCVIDQLAVIFKKVYRPKVVFNRGSVISPSLDTLLNMAYSESNFHEAYKARMMFLLIRDKYKTLCSKELLEIRDEVNGIEKDAEIF